MDKTGGAGFVLIEPSGERWRARVFVRRPLGGVRLAAEVTGSRGCVERIARSALSLLAGPDGEDLFVDFLGANRCRILGPAPTRGRPVPVQQPTGVAAELLSEPDDCDRLQIS